MVSDATIRKLVEEFYGEDLSAEELDQLVPHVVRVFENSRRLHELDLGSDDPRTMHYIRDRRLAP
jgi:hypothetical protein